MTDSLYMPQVSRDAYFGNEYDSREMFASYHVQVTEVLKAVHSGDKVLEVGCGNQIVHDILVKNGVDIQTVDIAKDLNPDYICSVTDLSKIFDENQFNVILCAEVLEHLPFEYFEQSLIELSKIAQNRVILTLPHFAINFGFYVKMPTFKRKSVILSLPFPRKHIFNGRHYWEIGKKGYSLRYIKSIISNHFNIRKTYLSPDHPYHRVFILGVPIPSPNESRW